MRLLLIFALVLASLGFGPSASARADHESEHASHTSAHDHNHGRQGDSEEQGKGHTVVHVCPGCAFLGVPALPPERVAPHGLPRLLANSPSLRSFNANPIPPPPRRA